MRVKTIDMVYIRAVPPEKNPKLRLWTRWTVYCLTNELPWRQTPVQFVGALQI